MAPVARTALRAGRSALASAIGHTVATIPPLEPAFVRAGRALSRRSRVAAGVYMLAQETLIARLSSHGPRYRDARVRNVALVLDVTEPAGRHAYFYGAPFERSVTDAVMTALRPGDVFVCAGAHASFFAILAAFTVGRQGRVIVFEPHEGTRAAMAFLVDRNDVEGIVETVPAALADADRLGSNTLDAWLDRRPDLARRLRCVKVDLAGGENRAVAGMVRSLASRDLTVVCSTGAASEADIILTRAGFARHPIARGTFTQGQFVYVRS